MKSMVLVLAGLLLAGTAFGQETELERALQVADRDSTRLIRFYSELMYGLVYVPVEPSAAEADTSRASALRPLVVEDAAGAYVPVFSRAEGLRAWSPSARYRAVAGSSVVAAVATARPGARMVLNPGGAPARSFTPREIDWLHRSWLASEASARVAGGTEVYIGGPAFDVPDAVITRLSDYLSRQAEVQAAYLSAFNMAGGKTGLLLTLTVDEAPLARLNALQRQAGTAVQDVLPENMVLSVGLYARQGLTEHARETGRRIYARAAR